MIEVTEQRWQCFSLPKPGLYLRRSLGCVQQKNECVCCINDEQVQSNIGWKDVERTFNIICNFFFFYISKKKEAYIQAFQNRLFSVYLSSLPIITNC